MGTAKHRVHHGSILRSEKNGVPDAKRVVVGEGLCNRSETGNGGSSTDIGFSEIQNIARAVAIECIPLTIGAGVQQIEEPGFAGSFPGVAGGIGAERS